MGLELRLNKIYTRHSFIPRFMNGKARLNLPGMSVDFLEVCLHHFPPNN